ncbi:MULTISPECIES: YfiR family protein [Inquilinus]|uniref:YfiR family protein n=1 Tax=Inquilinus ginsengisoli TaxID=363840 RepID=A0ABU1JR74_9PROT|nr:YfiR family protein [Inquilinus ginsengisoli]MDR6291108.1 hypothetical protein [Inquilinus ginsengisoli]
MQIIGHGPAPGSGRSISARLRGFACLAATVLLTLAAPPAPARSPVPDADHAAAVEQEVLGILSYTRWPAEPPELRLCVVGSADYADDLLAGATQASGRPVRSRRLTPGDPRIGTECDVVYLGALGEAERRPLYAQLVDRPILSISERDASCTVGSMFCLQIEDTQIWFQVNLDSVARSRVRINPKVLQLGRRRTPAP